MKKYQKPAMLALSLSANDTLCSTCGVKTRFEPALSENLEQDYLDGVNDGFFTEEEAREAGLFDDGSMCSKITFYCKFVSTSENMLFTS